MGNSLEEFRLLEKIKVSYLRNRGDLAVMIDELQLPKEYIEKQIEKFRRKDAKEVSQLIADNIMEHLLLGYEGRVHYLAEMVRRLEVEAKQLRSTCCNHRVREMDLGEEFAGQIKYECLHCHELADTYVHIDEKYMSLKLSTLDVLRKEDEAMAKFAEKMGYTKKGEPIQKVQITQIVVPGAKPADPMVIQDLDKLNPIEQESLRLELEKSIQEAEITTSDSTKQS